MLDIHDKVFKREQPLLATKSLVLQPLTEADAPAVAACLSDGKIAATALNIPFPYGETDARSWIASHRPKWHEGQAANYGIFAAQSHDLLGAISLAFYRNRANAELGYWVTVPYWGKGICTDAVMAMLAFGFTTLDLNKVKAHHLESNPASGRVMAKCGMKREGMLMEELSHGGHLVNVALYGLTKSSWLRHCS
jgi:RimJ/RimL family protein N-acetyltransferase